MISHLFAHLARHLITHALTPPRATKPRRPRAVAAPKVSLFAITNALHGHVVPPPLPAHARRAAQPRRAKVAQAYEC